MLRRIADTIILEPSREAITAQHKRRRSLQHAGGQLDLWIERTVGEDDAQLFVLKFGGAGSRAERATNHPLDFWDDLQAEVWSVNWPGYGDSGGRATLSAFAPAGDAVYQEIRRAAAGRPILVTGNSLGCTVALHVAAAHRDAAALLLRNVPPLKEVIVGKHGWWNAWAGAWLIAQQVPRELDAIAGARGSDIPALFVTSGRDRVVPVVYQEKVYEAYAGPKQCLVLADADHADPPGESDVENYRAVLAWLRRCAGF
jgi:pimeloyl-ACP methyl ester carboxylesterase